MRHVARGDEEGGGHRNGSHSWNDTIKGSASLPVITSLLEKTTADYENQASSRFWNQIHNYEYPIELNQTCV